MKETKVIHYDGPFFSEVKIKKPLFWEEKVEQNKGDGKEIHIKAFAHIQKRLSIVVTTCFSLPYYIPPKSSSSFKLEAEGLYMDWLSS